MHISFVRSITMDKWSDEQLKKMKVSEGVWLGAATAIVMRVVEACCGLAPGPD